MTPSAVNVLFIEDCSSTDIKKILQLWSSTSPQAGVLALVAERDRTVVFELQNLSRELSIPVIGGVFPELIVDGEFKKNGVLLLRFEKMPDYYLVPINADNEESAERIASHLLDIDVASRPGLLMFFDAMLPNISSVIESLYMQIGDDVHYMGSNAGSESFQAMECLFTADEYCGDAVLIMVLPDHPAALLEHNYHYPDATISATSTSGNRISTIDWRPAFDAYTDLAKSQYGVEINSQNFYEYAVHFPLGIVRIDGEVLVRIPVAHDETDGSIICVGEIPENAVMSLLKSVEPGSKQTTTELSAAAQLYETDMLLSFYCAGRRMHLAEAASTELHELKMKLAGKMVTGALSLGEIAGSKQGGYPLFHNAALVMLPWSIK